MASSSSSPSSSEPSFPIFLCQKGLIVSLFNKLVARSAYTFKPPAAIGIAQPEPGQLSIPLKDGKRIPSPEIVCLERFRAEKRHLESLADVQRSFGISFNDVPTEIDPKSVEPTNFFNLCLLWLHYRIYDSGLPRPDLMLTTDSNVFKEFDILEYFKITKKNPEEKTPLTEARLYSLLIENFFVPDGPSEPIIDQHIYIHYCSNMLNTTLVLSDQADHEQQFKDGGVAILYNKELYLKIDFQTFLRKIIPRILIYVENSQLKNHGDFYVLDQFQIKKN